MNGLKGTYLNGFESINPRKLKSQLFVFIEKRFGCGVKENFFGKMNGRMPFIYFIHSLAKIE